MDTFESAEGSEIFNNTLDLMAENLFRNDINITNSVEVPKRDLEKAAWLASILANSEGDTKNQKALSFAILAYLTYEDTELEELFKKYLIVQMTRLGSLPVLNAVESNGAMDLLDWQKHGSDSILMSEISQTLNYFRFGEDEFLTQFQKDIWALFQSDYLAFSGPTSSGKSHVLKEFVKQESANDTFQAVYVVPTRALISEVSGDLRSSIPEIRVSTGVDLDESTEDDFIFVLTPERCLSLLDYEDDDIEIDLIFLDEIQNLEDNSRGPLFENVLQSMVEIWPEAQVFAAGPYISNPGEVLSNILNVDPESISTSYTPVLHLEARFTFKKYSDSIDVEVSSPSDRKISLSIERPTGLNYSSIKNNKRNTIKQLVDLYGADNQNLIYSKTRKMAEGKALSLIEIEDNKVEDPRLEELVDFLSKHIHKEYSLVKTLNYGIAFHHSSVPSIARQEIEDLFRDEMIHTIVSTPTLLQGVNLPAEKMFILDPSKGRDNRLSDFDFQNLIGRTGRVGSRLYGTIIYVDREDDEWARDRMDGETEKQVVSATEKVFNSKRSELLKNIDNPNIREIGDDGLRYTITILRNKYQKEDHDLQSYLERNELTTEEIHEIESRLSELMGNLPIPEEVLRKNPTVDPILQNKLYQHVRYNVQDWEIQSRDLRDSFFNVSRRLNSVFRFTNDNNAGLLLEEGVEPETKEGEIFRVLYPGYHWLRGDSYNEMIRKRQAALDEETNIDTTIKNLMEIVNRDVRFILVRYFKILCDILKTIDDYENQFMLNFDKRLERGAYHPNLLKLIDAGVDRSIAIGMEGFEGNVQQYIHDNKDRFSPLVKRHLESQGLLGQ